jgi:hypothetical protein
MALTACVEPLLHAQAQAWHEAWWDAGGPLTQAGSSHMGEVVAVEAFFQLEQQLQFTEGAAQVSNCTHRACLLARRGILAFLECQLWPGHQLLLSGI